MCTRIGVFDWVGRMICDFLMGQISVSTLLLGQSSKITKAYIKFVSVWGMLVVSRTANFSWNNAVYRTITDIFACRHSMCCRQYAMDGMTRLGPIGRITLTFQKRLKESQFEVIRTVSLDSSCCGPIRDNSPVQNRWFSNDPGFASGVILISNWAHESTLNHCQFWTAQFKCLASTSMHLGTSDRSSFKLQSSLSISYYPW
jgi:hypothetical protein